MAHNPEYSETLHRTPADALDWKWLLALGIVMVLGGVLAFLFPFLASLTVEAVAGAAFLTAGVMEIWMAFRSRDERPAERWMNGLIGLGLVLLAIALLLNPLAGLVSLTLLAGSLFIAFGVLRIVLGLRHRHEEGWGWVIASGAISIGLGLMIVLTLPGSALGLLGIFLGVELIMSGTATIALALSARRKAEGRG